MAPEILNGEKYDKAVDWWAVGIMLYEMIFGGKPFNLDSEDSNQMVMIQKIDL